MFEGRVGTWFGVKRKASGRGEEEVNFVISGREILVSLRKMLVG